MLRSNAIKMEQETWQWRDIPWKVRQKGKELFDSAWDAAFGYPEAKPGALPMDGFPGDEKYTWDDWHRDMKRKYPVRSFINEELATYFRRAYRIFWKDPWYWLRTHTYNRYHIIDARAPQNGYAWGWMDRSEMVLYAAFAVLVDFVEKEYPGCVDWDATPHHKKARDEFLELYNWWKYGRRREHDEFDRASQERYLKNVGDSVPAKEPTGVLGVLLHELRLDSIYHDIFDKRTIFGEKGSWNYPEREQDFEKFHKWEDDLEKKDDVMLKRLIDIRGYLWT